MQKEERTILGKILGEIYRLEKKVGISCSARSGQIYALLNGFENAIEEEINSMGYVSKSDVEIVESTLDRISLDPEELKKFTGFYDIENELSRKGVNRGTAIKILQFFHADERFAEVIKKMDSSNSPSEARRFNLSEFEK